MPGEKRMKIPHGMPSLPLATQDELKKFENFLQASDVNLSAVVSTSSFSLATYPFFIMFMCCKC